MGVDFDRARTTMVDTQLRPASVTDRRILGAMGRLPRERFVPRSQAALAYIDDARPLKQGRFLSMPAQLARLLQLAEIGEGDDVLIVGAGTGYSAAVAAELAHFVVALEPDRELARLAAANVLALGIANVEVVTLPIAEGDPQRAPFDVIYIDGAIETVPPALTRQLAEGGRLVAVVADGPAATAQVMVRSGRDIARRRAFNASLPPLPVGERVVAFRF